MIVVIPLVFLLGITVVSNTMVPLTSALLFGNRGLARSLNAPPSVQTMRNIAIATAIGGGIAEFPGCVTAIFLSFRVLNENVSSRFSASDLAALCLHLNNVAKEQSVWVQVRIKGAKVVFSVRYPTCWLFVGLITLISVFIRRTN